MSDEDRPRFDVDRPAAVEEVFAQYPEETPADVLALAETPDPAATPAERAVGELLAEAVEAELASERERE